MGIQRLLWAAHQGSESSSSVSVTEACSEARRESSSTRHCSAPTASAPSDAPAVDSAVGSAPSTLLARCSARVTPACEADHTAAVKRQRTWREVGSTRQRDRADAARTRHDGTLRTPALHVGCGGVVLEMRHQCLHACDAERCTLPQLLHRTARLRRPCRPAPPSVTRRRIPL